MKVRKWLPAYKEDRSRRVLSTPTSDGDGPAHTLSVIFVIDNRPMPQLHTTHSDYLQFNNWFRSKYSLGHNAMCFVLRCLDSVDHK